MEAWRRAADYDGDRGSVKAWLLLRTRSRAIDFRKSAAVARAVPTGDGAWLASLVDPRTDDSEAPDRARIRRVLAELNAEQRDVLVLAISTALSSAEIATQLGHPDGHREVACRRGAPRPAPRARRSAGGHLMRPFEPKSVLPAFASEQASGAAGEAELAELLAQLSAVSACEASSSEVEQGRARLLATVSLGSERFLPLFDRLTKFFDLSAEALRAVFARADQSGQWQPGPCPGSHSFIWRAAPRWPGSTPAWCA